MNGGRWNRASRRSGGERPFRMAISARSATWEEWIASVRQMVRSATGILHVEAIVAQKQLREWFDAGERSSWVVSEILRRA